MAVAGLYLAQAAEALGSSEQALRLIVSIFLGPWSEHQRGRRSLHLESPNCAMSQDLFETSLQSSQSWQPSTNEPNAGEGISAATTASLRFSASHLWNT